MKINRIIRKAVIRYEIILFVITWTWGIIVKLFHLSATMDYNGLNIIGYGWVLNILLVIAGIPYFFFCIKKGYDEDAALTMILQVVIGIISVPMLFGVGMCLRPGT